MRHSIAVKKCVLVCEEVKSYASESTVTSPKELARICMEMGSHTASEEVVCMITFNAKGKILGFHEVSRGSLTESIVEPREVFKRAFLENAATLAVIHNHPSGDPTPSEMDRGVTKRLSAAGKLMGMPLVDHLILTPDGRWVSLKENDPELFESEVVL